MKKYQHRLTTLVLCLIFGLAGYAIGQYFIPTYNISLQRELDTGTDAMLFNSSFNEEEKISAYDASEALKIISDSSWSNQRIHKKGSWKIQLRNGTKINLSYYGNFFWLEGTPGFFHVPPKSTKEYQALLSKIHKTTVTWRKHRNEA